jgi:fructokinase
MRIGLDIGGTKVEGILLDASGRDVVRQRIATPLGDYDATIAAIAALAQSLLAAAGGEASIGVAMPGALSPATGLIKNANSTWLNGRPFDRDLTAAIGQPLRFANDANCLAVSEAVDGAAAGAEVVFGVILGTGVGGGIVAHGRPLTGANAIAGEWGHNPLPWPDDDERPGPACYCGRRGCIETFLSGPGLARDFHNATGQSLPADAIAAAAASGDAVAAASLQRYQQRLARALASVINLLDPDVIVLGGGLSNIESLTATVPLLWRRWIFSDHVATQLRRSRYGDSSGVRGAAWLWPPPG